jgi:hypothetical protein
LPLLEICQAVGDPAGKDALERVTFAGNVISAEPSAEDLAVFVIATLTVYVALGHSVWLVVFPLAGGVGVTAPVEGNSMV